ncbi:MAG TPA: P1 family peptidase [Thermomicrobiaceae bacterium]|nr:P1 family peptidase [Thermomicrobiaceae bacterium]
MSAGYQPSEPERPRAREVGVVLGTLPPGPLNAITDVPGVLVGQQTLIAGDGALVPGVGPIRTGVTVILPHGGNLFREKVPAACFVLNGYGKAIGLAQLDELGVIETPLALTGTLNVPLVADGLIEHAIRTNPDIGINTSTVNPVAAECHDGYLNDIQGRHVRQQHVLEAIASAADGPVAEGTVGGGTGMTLFGFKGGIGTASRVVDGGGARYTVGALVLGNFGRREQLVIAGVPVGRELATWQPPENLPEHGSIVVVVATDAPLLSRGLGRIARRGAHGLARVGSISGHGSGDFIFAFSNAIRVPHTPQGPTLTVPHVFEGGPLIDALFQATVEATEEAVVNALFRATTIDGRDGHVRYALPLEPALRLLATAGALSHPAP